MKIPQPIPYDLIFIQSRVLDCQVAIVRNSAIPSPDGAVRLTWKEAMALVESGVPRTDLARLFKIRDEFGGVFTKPGAPSSGKTLEKIVRSHVPAPPAAPTPQKSQESQGDLFA